MESKTKKNNTTTELYRNGGKISEVKLRSGPNLLIWKQSVFEYSED